MELDVALDIALYGLPRHQQGKIESARWGAVAYLWGWQDAGGAPPAWLAPDSDRTESQLWSTAFAWHVLQHPEFANDATGLGSAYKSWRETGEIR
jgi:hypothetical protein